MWTFCVACSAVSCGHCVLPVVHSLIWTLCFACCAQSHMDVVFCLLCTVSCGRCALHAGWCGCCVRVCRLTPTLRWCWARRSWTAETSTSRTLWTLSLAGDCLLSEHSLWVGCPHLAPSLLSPWHGNVHNLAPPLLSLWHGSVHVWPHPFLSPCHGNVHVWPHPSFPHDIATSTFGPTPSFPMSRQHPRLAPPLLSPCHGNIHVWPHPFFPHVTATSTFGPTPSFPMTWQCPHLAPPLLSPWHCNVHIWPHPFFPHDMAVSTFGPTPFFPHVMAASTFGPTPSFPMTWQHPCLVPPLFSPWHGNIHIWSHLFFPHDTATSTFGPTPFFPYDTASSIFSHITSIPLTWQHPHLAIPPLPLFLQWCGNVHIYPHPFFSHDTIITSTFSPITNSFPTCVVGWVGMKVNGKNIRCEIFSPNLFCTGSCHWIGLCIALYSMPVYSIGLRTWICWGWTENMDLLGLDWLRTWICWGWTDWGHGFVGAGLTEDMDLLGLDWLRTWICWGWTDWEHGFVGAGLTENMDLLGLDWLGTWICWGCKWTSFTEAEWGITVALCQAQSFTSGNCLLCGKFSNMLWMWDRKGGGGWRGILS